MAERINPIVAREKEILKFWQENKIFEKSLAATKDGQIFSFYDGPPFATGTPHYGHLVASIMKDAVPRFWTMKGYYVERRWGWDCHGLPVENLIEQELGLKSKKEIEEKGVKQFNESCRASVLRYADIWKKTIPRLGRWVDMEADYKTMEPWYMESIWWVFKELWRKKLIYEGYKAMHICPRCETTLSNFEVTQGYKDIKDISVTVKFELADEPGVFVLAWTTTPWTLIGNTALAVGEKIDYVLIKVKKENYILAKERLAIIKDEYEVVREFKGKELVGKKYLPLFDYYLNQDLPNKENLYTIAGADFVSTTDGTGVVHIAPAFGDEDMVLGQEKNLVFIQHVDASGRIKAEAKNFADLEVKPARNVRATDEKIIEFLGAKVFSQEEYSHSYPHCWRCDTPLLNYATSSWFVKVTAIKDDLIKNNQKINWAPAHLKEGRFGKWLAEVKDWAISRSRYWGTPLPLWRCACGEIKVVGSIEELEKLSGEKISDLHKDAVDAVSFKCAKCGQPMKRIPEVLDCWFESGAMPYAQLHYPFANQEKFEKSFPAQFIAEGVDQTRGWFYTLMVLSVALFNQPAFENVIANGIVLAGDGNKMSKRLKNYPEPDEIMEKFGADALRFYLLSSPVMLAENLNFSEDGVKEACQKVVLLADNILKFYQLYQKKGLTLKLKQTPKNVLDQWLLLQLNVLIKDVSQSMTEYQLPKAVRPIQNFIDQFSTWWLRRSRERFKTASGQEKEEALLVFGFALLTLAKVMAPFTPFVAEEIYQAVGESRDSVHLAGWPELIKIDLAPEIADKLLTQMEQLRKVVEMGLAQRTEQAIKIRQPLKKITVYGLEFNHNLAKLLAEELNVQETVFVKGGELRVELDTTIDQELKQLGLLRELVRTLNSLRKNQNLTIGDQIKIYWQSQAEPLRQVFANSALAKELKRAVLAEELVEKENSAEEVLVNEEKIKLTIEKI